MTHENISTGGHVILEVERQGIWLLIISSRENYNFSFCD